MSGYPLSSVYQHPDTPYSPSGDIHMQKCGLSQVRHQIGSIRPQTPHMGNGDIGLQWLRTIFIPQTSTGLGDSEYRLLLVDGHYSHATLDFMYECFINRIIP